MKTLLLSILTLAFTQTAFAASPHFINADITLTADGSLQCTWKEAGLGNNASITYTCGAEVVAAAWQCINKGGHDPEPKGVVDREVFATGTFASGKNGNIVGSLTVPIPTPGDLCPNRNWTLRFEGVRWCGTSLVDMTNGVVGAEVAELFMGDAAAVPSCDVLLTP